MKSSQVYNIPSPPQGKSGWPWAEETPFVLDAMPDCKSWPRISIVTPSYNQGQFIEETIRSVVIQGYPNLEYIIMDGGSTDNTIEIIKKYEPWINHWVNEKDRGQAHAVNKGWAIATGDILGWLNSDDFYMPGALHRVALAYENGARGLIYGDCRVADEKSYIRPGVKCMANYSLIRLLTEFTMPQPAVFVTANLITEVGYLDETLEYAMDFEYYLRTWISLVSQYFRYVPHVLAISREHIKTKSSRAFRRGQTDFVYENLRVLWNWSMFHKQRIQTDPELRNAFAIALIRQAKKLAWTGSTIPAVVWFLRSAKWSPKVCFLGLSKGFYKQFTPNEVKNRNEE